MDYSGRCNLIVWILKSGEQSVAIVSQSKKDRRVAGFENEEREPLIQLSWSGVSDSLRPHGLQHTSVPCPSPTPKAYSNSCSSSWWRHPTISSSVVRFSSHLQSSPASGSFQWVNSSHQVANIWSFSFSIRLSNEYSGLISFRIDWLDLLTVQGTQESSPTPQFKSINSSVLSFLYSPTLTSIHDHWKNHNFD